MTIIFFAHPESLGSQSMPRFVRMLADGMKMRGHQVELKIPKARFSQLPVSEFLKKWLGYIDQYIIFPKEVSSGLKQYCQDTLFVFTDQALGPWVPLAASRPHAIHCHDFLAQKSAQGKVKENPTGWTGRQYQSYIRRGYKKGDNFISVSENTREELHEFLSLQPSVSEVIYNGLNQSFCRGDTSQAKMLVGGKIQKKLTSGYILHVGGNQWYKNRIGVIEIYNGWRQLTQKSLPLIMIGPAASGQLMKAYSNSPYKSDIYLLHGMDDEFVKQAYRGASVFLFPSLAEGFGWPIAEAMASGCPVITTSEAPMTEVAGEAAFLIPRRPSISPEVKEWAFEASKVLEKVLSLTATEREKIILAGLDNSKRFNAEVALNKIEAIYQQILDTSRLQ